MDATWPWWLGGLALSVSALGFFALLRRPLGVTGLWRQVLDWRAERELARAEAAMPDDPAALLGLLEAATKQAFGSGEAPAPPPSAAVGCGVTTAPGPCQVPVRRSPWTAALAFLLMLAVGGALAALLRGGPWLRLEPDLAGRLGPALGWAALGVGGLLAGFGARLAGGCTSGHGLNGAARLQPGSLVAVACFFGAGAGVAFLLAALAGGAA